MCVMILLRVNTEIDVLGRRLMYGYQQGWELLFPSRLALFAVRCVYGTLAGIAKECDVFSLGSPCGMSCISFESPLSECNGGQSGGQGRLFLLDREEKATRIS